MKRKLSIIFIFFFSFLQPQLAHTLTDEQNLIIRYVMGGGAFNSQVHSTFWARASEKDIRSARENSTKLRGQIFTAMDAQRELYRSARLSFLNKKVTKTEEYDKAKLKAGMLLGNGATEHMVMFEKILKAAALRITKRSLLVLNLLL